MFCSLLPQTLRVAENNKAAVGLVYAGKAAPTHQSVPKSGFASGFQCGPELPSAPPLYYTSRAGLLRLGVIEPQDDGGDGPVPLCDLTGDEVRWGDTDHPPLPPRAKRVKREDEDENQLAVCDLEAGPAGPAWYVLLGEPPLPANLFPYGL